MTMQTAAASIAPTERLIVRYRTQLDANTNDGAALTNFAGAIQWFNRASSNPQRVVTAASHLLSQRTQFAGRPRMGLTPSSNGRELYIHTAGPTIDVYDAQSFKKLRTVDLGQDMSGLIIIPQAPAPRPANAGR